MKRSIYHLTITTMLAAACILSSACRKVTQVVYVAPDSSYSGRIEFVLRNNPAQDSLFYNFLESAGFADTLSTPGPFTVFVPVNAAMHNVYSLDPRPYIVPGEFLLSKIPLGATEVLTTMDGNKIFLTGHSSGSDTVYTANGSIIQLYDQKATNGVIQVMGSTFSAPDYPTCLQFLNSDGDLVLFAYAVKRAHLDSLLNDSTQAYSVLAPTNEALSGAGYSLDVLSQLTPDSAASIVGNYIIPGRYFLYDYFWLSQQSGADPISVTTLNGDSLTVYVDLINFAFAFYMNQNWVAYPQNFNPTDVPTGIGTVEVVNGVIMP